jgi:hypothetical protein
MPPGEMPAYDFQFKSMAEFANAHQEQLRSQGWTGSTPRIDP